jgi:tRNA(Ile)-lysidine synthase TilS/MesJ
MQWWMTRRAERQATRMHEMMDRLNVDAAALARARQGELYAQARARCLACELSAKCLDWLDSQPASKDVPRFCANWQLFEQYRKS